MRHPAPGPVRAEPLAPESRPHDLPAASSTATRLGWGARTGRGTRRCRHAPACQPARARAARRGGGGGRAALGAVRADLAGSGRHRLVVRAGVPRSRAQPRGRAGLHPPAAAVRRVRQRFAARLPGEQAPDRFSVGRARPVHHGGRGRGLSRRGARVPVGARGHAGSDRCAAGCGRRYRRSPSGGPAQPHRDDPGRGEPAQRRDRAGHLPDCGCGRRQRDRLVVRGRLAVRARQRGRGCHGPRDRLAGPVPAAAPARSAAGQPAVLVDAVRRLPGRGEDQRVGRAGCRRHGALPGLSRPGIHHARRAPAGTGHLEHDRVPAAGGGLRPDRPAVARHRHRFGGRVGQHDRRDLRRRSGGRHRGQVRLGVPDYLPAPPTQRPGAGAGPGAALAIHLRRGLGRDARGGFPGRGLCIADHHRQAPPRSPTGTCSSSSRSL